MCCCDAVLAACDSLDGVQCCGCCCCCGESDKKVDKREESKNTEKMMRYAIFALYAYVIILASTMDTFLWEDMLSAILFIGMFCYSLYLIEKLRSGDPGTYHPSPTDVVDVEFEIPVESHAVESPNTNSGLKQRNVSGSNTPTHEDAPIEATQPLVPSQPALPARTKYCKICLKNIAKYDHHCVWIGTCVGEKNQFDFVLFLFVEFLFLFFCMIVCINACYRKAIIITHNVDPSPRMVFSMLLLIPTAIINVVFMLFPMMMFGHHFYLVCTNQTSYESYKQERLKRHERVTYDEGCRTNWAKFLLQGKTGGLISWTAKPLPKQSRGDCCDCTCCDGMCSRFERICNSCCSDDGCCC